MNADGSRPVVTDLSAGATAPGLRWVWIGQYIGAGLALIAGTLLVLWAVRRPDRQPDPGPPPLTPGSRGPRDLRLW